METHMVSYNLYDIPVYFKDKFVDQDIDVNAALEEIEQRVPPQFLYGIDTIFVGSFEDLDNKNTNAKLENGAIYISNEQDSEEDMIDDIVHEIAHNVENLYGKTIYGDSTVEVEFLGKRKRLLQILQAEYGAPAVKSVVAVVPLTNLMCVTVGALRPVVSVDPARSPIATRISGSALVLSLP